MGNAYGRMFAMASDPNTPVEILVMLVARIARSEWIMAIIFLIYFAITLVQFNVSRHTCMSLDDEKEKDHYKNLSCEEYFRYLQALAALSFSVAMLYLLQSAILRRLAFNYRSSGSGPWHIATATGVLILLLQIVMICMHAAYTTSFFWIVIWIIAVISSITRIRVVATIGKRCVQEASLPQLPHMVVGPAAPVVANATPIDVEAEYAPTPIVVHAVAVPANSK